MVAHSPTMIRTLHRALNGPTLVVQIVMLLLGGLVVAQIVTLLLTLLLPPAPAPQYQLGSVATALRGDGAAGNLLRTVQAGPPDLGGRGWLVSEGSRLDLAGLLRVDPADVRLSFYTPLPFAGTVAARKLAMVSDGPVAPSEPWLRLASAGSMTGPHDRARLILAQAIVPAMPFPGGREGRMLPDRARRWRDAASPALEDMPRPFLRRQEERGARHVRVRGRSHAGSG